MNLCNKCGFNNKQQEMSIQYIVQRAKCFDSLENVYIHSIQHRHDQFHRNSHSSICADLLLLYSLSVIIVVIDHGTKLVYHSENA